MKNKKYSSPPPPKRSKSQSESEEEETDVESELETNHQQESSGNEDNSDQESDNGEKSSSRTAKIRQRRVTLSSDVVFTESFLRSVADKFTSNDTEPYKKTLAEYDWASLSDHGDELKNHLQKVCNTVVRNLTMHQVLNIACTDKKYLFQYRRKRGLNAFSLFVKEFAKANPTADNSNRFAEANKAYKQLSAIQRQELMEKANKLNLEANVENGVSSKVPAKSPAKPNYPSVKSFFETSSTSGAQENKTEEPNTSTASKKSNSFVGNNMETVAVKVYDYFAEERKRKFGKEKAEVVRKAFAELSVERKVKLMYKIMESVESKFNKRAVLSKQDQDMLDSYEQRPAKPGTAYNLFVGEKYSDPEIAALPFTERTKKIGSLWKNLDASAKSVYEKKLAQKKFEFETNYNRFLTNLPQFRREQEYSTQKSGKRVLKRRASVGEEAPTDEESIPSKESKKLTPVAAKRTRSKTVDCSAMSKIDVLKFKQEVEVTPPSAKKAKKSNEIVLNGTEIDDSVFVSPTKKVAKEKAVADVEKTPVSKEKKTATPVAKAKKNTPAKEVPKVVIKERVSDSQTPTEKGKKKKANESVTEDESVVSPTKKVIKETKIVEKLPSPIKEPVLPVKGNKSKKKQPTVAKEEPPSPEEIVVKSPVKEKKTKAAVAKGVKSPADQIDSASNEPTVQSAKKPKKKNKVPIPEPEKPPQTTKEYFKTIYEGDKDKANKVFKKLPQEEKERYHEQLKLVTDKYIEDFRRYLESLSKEEIADYMKRHNN